MLDASLVEQRERLVRTAIISLRRALISPAAVRLVLPATREGLGRAKLAMPPS